MKKLGLIKTSKNMYLNYWESILTLSQPVCVRLFHLPEEWREEENEEDEEEGDCSLLHSDKRRCVYCSEEQIHPEACRVGGAELAHS